MKFLILRRISQITILLLFFLSANYGFEILQGDLSSSLLFSVVPLSDPFALVQLLFAGASLGASAFVGAFIIFCIYAFIAPRAFCSWVCPINLFTDISYKIRTKLGFSKEKRVLIISKNIRYYILALSLILSFLLSIPAFESVSFIGIVHRGIIFGGFFWLGVVLCIMAFDIFFTQRGVCSHICPLGAFYALISKFAFIRIKHNLDNCTKCMKCKIICPEDQVLGLIGKKSGFVKNSECISCGRCIDVCGDDALKFSIINLRRK